MTKLEMEKEWRALPMNSDPSVHHLFTALPLKAKCAMRNQAHRYDCLIAYPIPRFCHIFAADLKMVAIAVEC